MFAYCFYLPLCNGNLTLAQQHGYRWATVTLPLRSGKYHCYVRTGNTHYKTREKEQTEAIEQQQLPHHTR